jgi:pimeloyl-ACP methyl ester carboxylesterase
LLRNLKIQERTPGISSVVNGEEIMMADSGYLDVDGGRLWYEMAGKGETLVLIHAGVADSRMWDDQWQAFTQRYRVVRFDQRGFGKSDPAQGPVSRRADLLRLLDGLGVAQAAFLGSSLGGGAAIDLAIEHPECVAALIIVSATPSGFELQGEPPRYLMEMIGAAQQGDLERTTDLQVRIFMDGPFREPDEVPAPVRQRFAEMTRIPVRQGTLFVADGQPLNPLDPPASTRLAEIQAPTLVIAGERDDPEILRAADVMASQIRGAQKVIIPEGAHLLNMEHPQAFNQAVLDFLGGLKQG